VNNLNNQAMKNLILLIAVCLGIAGNVATAQDITSHDVLDLEFTPVSDPDFDWFQFEEKQAKAVIGKNGLELESKEDDVPCISVCELPINMESDDFLVALKMIPGSIDDKKPFGVVYDYKNDANFKMLLILKKGYQIVECEDGNRAVVKKGLYKGKDKEFIISIMRNKNKVHFGINNINLTTQLNANLKYPTFGFVITTKGKLIGKSIAYKKVTPKDHEEDQ